MGFLYQVALLDNMGAHFVNQIPIPYILRAGSKLHGYIGNLIEDKSISICDPQAGRPLKLKREKTGIDKLNIEYSCTDEDPAPLPQQLWGLLQNLIDLEQLVKVPTKEDQLAAVADMGLYPTQASYTMQQQPTPPQNPYAQQPVAPPMPNIVQPQQPNYQQPSAPPVMNPPPINVPVVSSTEQYYPQPSQVQHQQQQQPAQSAQQPVQRNPVQQQPQQQPTQPSQSLEDLQRAAQGK